MKAIAKTNRKSAFRALIVPIAAAALVALAVPSWAGTTVRFDPTGGNGANPGTTINAAGFSWAPGNAVAIGAITPGVGPVVGTTFTLKYQAILQGISGTTLNGGAVLVASQQNDTTPVNGGEIVTTGAGGASTGKELTITAVFQERITAVDTVSQPGFAKLTFSFVPGAPNLVSIYDAPAGTAKNFAGTGFDAGTLILQGSVVQNGLEGPYQSTFSTQTTGTTAFNQYSAASDPDAAAFWAGKSTTSGTGSTFLPVQIDPTKTNTSFFPTSGPSFIQINFPSVSTADPFNSVSPSKTFFGGTTPNLFGTGTVNGLTGTDIQFQVLAANDFTVPEPAAIVQALTAASLLPMFLCIRRFRSRKTAA